VAEDKKEASGDEKKGSSQKPVLFIVLLVINLIFMGAVAFMLYSAKEAEKAEVKMDDVLSAEKTAQDADAQKADEFIGHLVPLETFLVNLSGVRGGRLMKVTMSLEVDSLDVQNEVDKRKAEIRDTILILLASKNFEQISSRDGKDFLRDEVKDTLNSFLTKGKVKRVLFTEFFYN